MPFIPLDQPRKATDPRFPRVSDDEQAARDADAEQLIAGEFDQDMPAESRAALESEYRQRFGKKPQPSTGPVRGFIPLANAEEVQPVRRGFTPLIQEEPERPNVLKTVALENPLTAAGEAALNLGSQAVGMPVAGIAGLATAAGNAMGLTDKSAADVVHSVGDALVYRPRGEMGSKAAEIVAWPFEKLSEGGQYVGGKVLDVTGSPVLATAADTAVNALPMVIAPAVKGARKAIAKPAETAPRVEPTMPERAQGFTPLEIERNGNAEAVEQGTKRLDSNDPSLSGQDLSGVSVVRSARDKGVRGMADELSDVPARRGESTDPAAHPGAAEHQGRLRAEQLSLDDTRRTKQAADGVLPEGGIERAELDAGRSRAMPRDEQWNATEANERGMADSIDSGSDAAAGPKPKTARYALIEADDLKASHDTNLRPIEENPFGRKEALRHENEAAVQKIVSEFDPKRLAEALDDADGAPVVARDGVVEAGQRRAIAMQRVYQANGLKAEAYRAFLRESAPRLGLDPGSVDQMKKPVLVRIPDEAAPRHAETAMPADGTVNSFAPGARYTGFIDDTPQPGAGNAGVTPESLGRAGKRSEPIRREDILIPFLKALDTSLYEGRVQGKNRLGFFRPKNEEVRIKRHADLETAAHELAHLMDKRIPEIRKAWENDKALAKELKAISYDAGKVYEGFAEGIRLWMTQPDVLQAKAPRFAKWFDDFAQRHEYGPAILKAREGMTEWFGQEAIDRARSKIGDHAPLSDAMNGMMDRFRQSVSDDLHGVYRMERELQNGKIASVGAYETARLSRASASIADGAIRFGYPVKKADGSFTYRGKGLEDILKPVAENLDDALLYFVGKSSRELMTQGREYLFTPGEIDGMLRLRTPEREAAFKAYQEWNKGILDFAEAHGVINSEARRLWQRTQYLPFQRVGQPGGFKGKPGDWSGVKALTGGTENIRDILGNMTSNAAQLIDKSVKNEARLKIAELAESAEGGGKFMTRIPAESRPVRIDSKQVIDALMKSMGVDSSAKLSTAVAKAVKDLRAELEASPAMLEVMQPGMPPAGGNVVAVLKDGKPTFYEVADPILYRALSALDRPPMDWIVKWLGLPKRIGQATITLDLSFIASNLSRDQVMSGVMTRSGFRPVVDAMNGLKSRFAEDPVYREWVANGGGLSSLFLDENKLRTHMDRFYVDHGINPKSVIDAPGKALYFIERMGDAIESSSRIGEFGRAIERGENPRHAAYRSREISVDWAMKGDNKALGVAFDTVMFLRAAVVSMDRVFRGVAHDPNRGAIAAKAGLIGLASAALYLMNRGDPRYDDMEDWKKDAFWHVFVGKEHFMLPKAFEVGAIGSLAERTIERTLDHDPEGLGKDAVRIIGNLFGLNWKPQIVAPVFDQATNRQGVNRSRIETPGMEDLQPFLRAKPTTSETLKAAGMATRNLPEGLQVNPVRAEALLRGYFNSFAAFGLTASDAIFFSGTKPEMRADEMPVLRRFYAQEPPRSTKFDNQFFEMLGEAKRLHGTMRELDRLGRPDLADEKEREPMATEAKPLERAAKNLSGVNKDMLAVRRSDATPAEKRQQLDALTVERNALLKGAVLDSKNARKEKK